MKKLNIVVAVVSVMLLVVAVGALLSSQVTLSYTGAITGVNLAIYSDAGLTQPCTSLNVGIVDPGSTVTQNIWIKNTGNVPETLTMSVSNWIPANATTVLTMSWNKQNTVLAVGASTPAIITLVVAANTDTMTTFSCSVTLTGQQ